MGVTTARRRSGSVTREDRNEKGGPRGDRPSLLELLTFAALGAPVRREAGGLLHFDDVALRGGDDRDQLVAFLGRDAELVEGGDEVAGECVEFGAGDHHAGVEGLHRLTRVLLRATGG